MNSTNRVKQYRLKQKELGRSKRDYYVTDSEHEQLRVKLKKIRGEQCKAR